MAVLLLSSFTGWPGANLKETFKAVVPNLGPPDVLRLQLPEILASTGGGEGFWELQFKKIWRPKVGDHCFKGSERGE